MRIRFAPFHMLVQANSEVSLSSNRTLHRDFVLKHLLSESRIETQDDLLNMFFSTARAFHPDSHLDLLTDEHTEFKLANNDVKVWRYALNGSRVMLSRLIAQISYLKSLTDDATVLFMDSDMLVNGSLQELDSDSYALALTVRNNAEMPLNGGFIAVSGRRRREGIEILEQVLDIYQNRYSDQALWWGDQLALRDVILDMSNGSTEWSLGSRGAVNLLPSSVYNFSSDYGRVYADILRPLRVEKVLHFKGDRKKAMRYYWKSYCAPDRKLSSRTAIFVHAFPEAVTRVLRSLKGFLTGRVDHSVMN